MTPDFAEIEKAIVTVCAKGGRGTLVGSNLILSAAHCIDYECTGGMVLGDYHIEEIETTRGLAKAQPLAVEPISDVAALGALDDQAFAGDAMHFEKLCEQIKPVPVCQTTPELMQPFAVYIYDHDRKWIAGTATVWTVDQPMMFVEPSAPIKGGASGGPIVNEAGELVAVVSNFSESTFDGSAPCLSVALPAWVLKRIVDADGEAQS